MKVPPKIRGVLAAVALPVASLAAPAEDDHAARLARAAALDEQLRAAEALAVYEEIERINPGDPAVLLGMARQHRHLMADASGRAEKLRRLQRSLALSQQAVERAPREGSAHLSVAITYAKLAALQNTREKLDATRRMKAAAERALQLNPQLDLAWYLIGRWHAGYAEVSPARRAVGEMIYGSIPTSTWEEAAAAFQRARSLNPDRLIHVAELGRAYAALGRTAEARKLLNQAVEMPAVEKDDPEAKQRAREALSTLR